MISLAVAALLLVQDPAGDTFGNGSLVPPTAAVYRTLGSFDVTSLEVLEGETLNLRLSFAAMSNPFDLPNGFSLPIIELYIADDTVGRAELLPGSGLALPGETTWHYAFKLSGDGSEVIVADGGTLIELPETQVRVRTESGSLLIETSLPRPESFSVFGAVGNYSPFTESGWQPLSATPSPWSFSSGEQAFPVVEVVAETPEAQIRALETGILPALRGTSPSPSRARSWNIWLFTMIGGALLGLAGLLGRFWSKSRPVVEALPQTRGEIILPTKRIHAEDEPQEGPDEKLEASPQNPSKQATEAQGDDVTEISNETTDQNPTSETDTPMIESSDETPTKPKLPLEFEEDWFDLGAESEDALEHWEDASPSETGDDVYTPDVKPS